MSTAIALLIGEAIKLSREGIITANEARKNIAVALEKTFGDYDISKVFWRTAYTYGLWGAIMLVGPVWIKYKEIEFANDPEVKEATPDIVEWADSLLGFISVQPLMSPLTPFFKWITQTQMTSEQKEKLNNLYNSKVNNDIVVQIYRFLSKNGGIIIIGAPLAWGLMEYNQYNERKESIKLEALGEKVLGA